MREIGKNITRHLSQTPLCRPSTAVDSSSVNLLLPDCSERSTRFVLEKPTCSLWAANLVRKRAEQNEMFKSLREPMSGVSVDMVFDQLIS